MRTIVRKSLWIIVPVLFVMAQSVALKAEIVLPNVLGDNMVLQQQTEVELWGSARANGRVRVEVPWQRQKIETTADAAGQWSVKVKTPEAGGPYEISIADADGKRILKNVLLGEVWLCSGQSNMEMPMRGFVSQPVRGGNDVIAAAKKSVPIRMFSADYNIDGIKEYKYSEVEQTDVKGEWWENEPAAVASTSAAAYYFAKNLQEYLDVPVGLIVTSLGGSKIEPWMSRECAMQFPEIKLDDLSGRPIFTPIVLYNAKIAPFVRYALRGFLWYQGESNRGDAEHYATYFAAMVNDWRARWGGEEKPFYAVEIAPYNYENAEDTSAAVIREAQLRGVKMLRHSGLVSTIDIGNRTCIHPQYKDVVGMRLAQMAFADTYGGRGFISRSPEFMEMVVNGNKAVLKFDYAPHGLSPLFDPLEGFEVAGSDRKFVKASARVIAGRWNEVEVWSDEVPEPVAVRYCFKDFTTGNVTEPGGWPLLPFRTDSY